jgi:seryl-tRNA synthetase
MTETLSTPTPAAFLGDLIQQGVLLETGERGVYGKSATFERIIDGLNALATKAGADLEAEVVNFPPVITLELLERTDYLNNFPHLAGVVDTFLGNEREHLKLLDEMNNKGDWTSHMKSAGLALAPAACYSIYPMAAGTLPEAGRTFEVQSYCFRHEPSDDPARMQIFRMHEFVRLGTPADVVAFRDMWLDRSTKMLNAIGLDVKAVPANDPFFGRGGKMLASSQREQALKFELVYPITSEEKPTAITSCNYHHDHTGAKFDIFTPDGAVAHAACVGFGLERIALALFKTHGLDVSQWPVEVTRTLGL